MPEQRKKGTMYRFDVIGWRTERSDGVANDDGGNAIKVDSANVAAFPGDRACFRLCSCLTDGKRFPALLGSAYVLPTSAATHAGNAHA